MPSDTVTHLEYSNLTGERYETKKPQDSDILRGDGAFLSETDKSVEYTAKMGERYEAVKQGSSDIWKVSNRAEIGHPVEYLRSLHAYV